eukprot:g19790.t1
MLMLLLLMTPDCRAEMVANSPSKCSREDKTDHGDGAPMRSVTNTTYQECALLCAADLNCGGAITDPVGNGCYLRSVWGGASTRDDRVSLQMTEECRAEMVANSPSKCMQEKDTDHSPSQEGAPSQIIRVVEGIKYDDCKPLCAADSNCSGFAHDQRPGGGNDSEGSCYLKEAPWPGALTVTNVFSLQMTPECRAEVIANSPSKCMQEKDTDHDGWPENNLGVIQGIPYEECLRRCGADANCSDYAAQEKKVQKLAKFVADAMGYLVDSAVDGSTKIADADDLENAVANATAAAIGAIYTNL